MKICLFIAGILIGLFGIIFGAYYTYTDKVVPYKNENIPMIIMGTCIVILWILMLLVNVV